MPAFCAFGGPLDRPAACLIKHQPGCALRVRVHVIFLLALSFCACNN